jgi:hypothetical protein
MNIFFFIPIINGGAFYGVNVLFPIPDSKDLTPTGKNLR